MRLVEAHVLHLVGNITKKNYKASTAELQQLVQRYGADVQVYLLRCLFKYVNIADNKGGKDQQYQTQILAQELAALTKSDGIATTLCSILESPEHHNKGKFPTFFFPQLARLVKLSTVDELLIGLAAAQSSKEDVASCARTFAKGKLTEVLAQCDPNLPERTLHKIIIVILSGTATTLGVSAEACEGYLRTLRTRLELPADSILLPLLEREPSEPSVAACTTATAGPEFQATVRMASEVVSVAGLIRESGYACCATVAGVADVLSQVPDHLVTASCVARVLGMMNGTFSGLDDAVAIHSLTSEGASWEKKQDGAVKEVTGWQIENFVDALKDRNPGLSWREVIERLDYPTFELSGIEGLGLILRAYRRASESPFPIDVLFQPWENTSGQLSVMRLLSDPRLATQPDVASLTALPMARLSTEGLKSVSGNADRMLPLWTSLDYLRCMMHLGESGHYQDVLTLLDPLMGVHPDVLALGITAACPGVWGAIQRDIAASILPTFLEPNPNSSHVLSRVFASRKEVVLDTILSWYAADPNSPRLIRILDIVQDIKGLLHVLMAPQPAFVLDLAILASHRGFLNLEKWLLSQMTERGQVMIGPSLTAAEAILSNQPAGGGNPAFNQSALTILNVLHVSADKADDASRTKIARLLETYAPKTMNIDRANDAPKGHDKIAGGLMPTMATPADTPDGGPSLTDGPPTDAQRGTWSSQYSGNFQASYGIQPTPAAPPSSTVPADYAQSPLVNAAGGVAVNPMDAADDGSGEGDYSNRLFSKTIDDEANSYFAQLYTKQLSIEDVVALLQQLKASTVKHENDVFACMIRNLFDEYRFFQQYPESELGITGILFGCLVQSKLVEKVSLKKALKYVLESLKKEPKSKMHRFSICALNKFKQRLPEWPEYCQLITQTPHFHTFPQDLKTVCTAGASPLGGTNGEGSTTNVGEAAGGASGGAAANGASGTAAAAPAKFGSSNVKVLLNAAESGNVKEPSAKVQERIHFVFNNISAHNLDQKARELMEVVTDDDFPWMAQYLVVKRCALEPNFHTLYLQFMEQLNLKAFNKAVLKETLMNVRLLLHNRKITDTSSSSERTLLRNLGAWLGQQTLARNKPILHNDLPLKFLIRGAYSEGTKNLLYIIPFVRRVLEATRDSVVFRPPNPWTMAILSLLKELHQLPELKLNLKFEVELLCKHLNIDLEEIHATHSLAEVQHVARGDELEGAAPVFHDLVAGQSSSMKKYIVINPGISLFQQHPQLHTTVWISVERAVDEIINPVVDRSIKIACISSQKLILKDFALEPDEGRLREAAHHVVRHLAGSLVMVTAKDPVRMSIGSHLRNLLMSSLPPDIKSNPQMGHLVDQAIQAASTDNLALACAFIEKTAMERAVPEVDELLKDAYSQRMQYREARAGPGPFLDAKNYGTGVSTLPPALRPKPGGLDPGQLALYMNFLKPAGQLAPSEGDQPGTPTPSSGAPRGLGDGDLPPGSPRGSPGQMSMHDTLFARLDKAASQCAGTELGALPNTHEVPSLLRMLRQHVAQHNSIELGQFLVKRVVPRLFDGEASSNAVLRDSLIAALGFAFELNRVIAAEAANEWVYLPDDRKLNTDITARMLRVGLLDAACLDRHLAKGMDEGRNYPVVAFVEELLAQCFFTEPRSPLPVVTDLATTIDTIVQLAAHASPPHESRTALAERLSRLMNLSASTTGEGLLPRPDAGQDNDPPALREQVLFFFEEWQRLTHDHMRGKAGGIFVTRLMQQGLLRTDDISSRFFRICADHAITSCLSVLQPASPGGARPTGTAAYHGVDAFSKLIIVLLTHFGESTKVALLNKVLKTIIAIVLRDQERYDVRFNQKPYFRMLCNLVLEVSATDETVSFQVCTGFTHALHLLRPTVAPGFAFAWLELVSHRNFMPRLLLLKESKGWQMLQRLLVDLFQYMAPFLRGGLMDGQLPDSVRLLYKGSLRMLLVLLHDFPEFLASYHFSLCDAIPTECIQMRNLILSAFPRAMRLPDPFTPNLKIDLLPEIAQVPRFLSQYAAAFSVNQQLRQDIDAFFRGEAPPQFLAELPAQFNRQAEYEGGSTVNVSLLNAVVMHVGIKSMESLKPGSAVELRGTVASEIYRCLASKLAFEARYLFVNAIANQLRYPNSHTHFFSCALLHVFSEAETDVIREQITRVLLERLIVNRPHPWGLLTAFVELIQNPVYDFWSHEFVRCAPEIEKLFESVARSCLTASRAAGVDGAQQ